MRFQPKPKLTPEAIKYNCAKDSGLYVANARIIFPDAGKPLIWPWPDGEDGMSGYDSYDAPEVINKLLSEPSKKRH